MVDEQKVSDKVEEIVVNVEASTQLASEPYDPVGEPGDDKRVFLEAANSDAKRVKVTGDKVTDKDIWEEIFMQNTTQPAYVLRWHAGEFIPQEAVDTDVASFRFNDYGQY